MPVQDLRDSNTMRHLLDALERGEDIGHFGRLAFAMVGRHFVDRDELVELPALGADCDEEKARALVQQVEAHDYSPPSRERILEWQAQQKFPICPDASDPDACNVYGELRFPDRVYEEIEEYRAEQFDASGASQHTSPSGKPMAPR
jgi:hypothetical protein